ncbi:MAG: GFA family protein [Gammaproteobacteria bacterium]|nr:MAG: GFA family protein [Gammaproteobacteria bacterium]
MKHAGSCHCGAVVIQIEAPAEIELYECNCSMCSRTGFLHLIVSKKQFQLVKGMDNLTTYTFNTRVAQHYFCKNCGCKPFYVPRSNPDGFSINFRCLDKTGFTKIKTMSFNGQEWESQGHELAVLSK